MVGEFNFWDNGVCFVSKDQRGEPITIGVWKEGMDSCINVRKGIYILDHPRFYSNSVSTLLNFHSTSTKPAGLLRDELGKNGFLPDRFLRVFGALAKFRNLRYETLFKAYSLYWKKEEMEKFLNELEKRIRRNKIVQERNEELENEVEKLETEVLTYLDLEGRKTQLFKSGSKFFRIVGHNIYEHNCNFFGSTELRNLGRWIRRTRKTGNSKTDKLPGWLLEQFTTRNL